jgi:hypothetical protein
MYNKSSSVLKFRKRAENEMIVMFQFFWIYKNKQITGEILTEEKYQRLHERFLCSSKKKNTNYLK